MWVYLYKTKLHEVSVNENYRSSRLKINFEGISTICIYCASIDPFFWLNLEFKEKKLEDEQIPT